jgi:hypothetical protein
MAESIVLTGAITLVVIGIVNILVILEVLGRKGGKNSLRALHRWLGFCFVILFTGLFAYMVPRIAFFENIPVNFLVHGFTAIVVFSLLIVKLIIVRRYKLYMGSLPSIGLYLMIGTILIAMSSAGVALFKRISG